MKRGDLVSAKLRSVIVLENYSIEVISEKDIFTVLKKEKSILNNKRIKVLSKFGIGSCYESDLKKI